MEFSIRSNIRDVSRGLTKFEKQALPEAIYKAVNRAAYEVRDDEKTIMGKVFDRVTPYAKNALRVDPGTKNKPDASLLFKDFSAKGTPAKRFLNPEIRGGGRSTKSHERKLLPVMGGNVHTVPAKGARLNNYGNINGGTYMQIVSRLKLAGDQSASNSYKSKKKQKERDYFAISKQTGKLRPGVYERLKKKVKPILMFTKAQKYKARFPFYTEGRRRFPKHFKRKFDVELNKALATLRSNMGMMRDL